MTFEAPFSRWRETVIPDWTDYNGHMNVAYFALIFDHATDIFYPAIGLGEPYRERTGKSTYAVETHLTYGRGANEGDEVIVTTQLLGFDEKRLHYFNVMSHAEDGYQMATQEQMALHVDLAQNKVEPMSAETLDLLAQMAEAHGALPRPPEAGRAITLASKKKG